MVTARLLATIKASVSKWGIDLETMQHVIRAGDSIEKWGNNPYLEKLRQESAVQHSDT